MIGAIVETKYGKVRCSTWRSISLGAEMNEDCLNLNIWSPSPDSKKRPVMVWIHGRAYVTSNQE
ncbi:carboxylesterase family protein [Paenibacillus sp. FSL W8-0186]|uniref:carboxylesterase family protein n=1 Tax=Paenibacillus sp. FSL W8-0186 TaxID=2921709 RepID=UPI0030CF1759